MHPVRLLFLTWIQGNTLNEVINSFPKNKIDYLGYKTAKLLKKINLINISKNSYKLRKEYINDRIKRILFLKKAIKNTNNKNELKLFNLLYFYFNKYQKYLRKMPLVFSHGDFHFSNLVYFKNKIYAIDFNRSTFEFQYQDLIKLYFFDNKKNNYFVKKTIHYYFEKNSYKKWENFKFLNIMFCLTSWQWAYMHKNNHKLYNDFLNLIIQVVNDYDAFKLLIPKSLI